MLLDPPVVLDPRGGIAGRLDEPVASPRPAADGRDPAATARRRQASARRSRGDPIDGCAPMIGPAVRQTEDPECGGFSQTKIAVPGKSRPRRGLHWPQIPSCPAGHSGSTMSRSTKPAPTISRTRSPRVRCCSTYRGLAGRVGLHVRPPVEVGVHRDQPALAGVVEEDPPHRVGHREDPPPARPQHPEHLAHQGGRVGDERHRAEGGAHDVEPAGAERQRQRVALHQRHPYPRDLRAPHRVPQHARGQVGRDHPGALRAASHRAAAAAPQPTSSTRRPAHRRRAARRRPRAALPGTRRSRRRRGTRRVRPGTRRRPSPTSPGWPGRASASTHRPSINARFAHGAKSRARYGGGEGLHAVVMRTVS